MGMIEFHQAPRNEHMQFSLSLSFFSYILDGGGRILTPDRKSRCLN